MFTTDFEPDPPPTAHPKIAAEFIDGVVIPSALRSDADAANAGDGRPSRREIREAVKHYGYPWNKVASELRHLRLVETAPSGDDIVEVNLDGIAVNHTRLHLLQPDLAPICPFKNSFVNTWYFKPVFLEGPCNSGMCANCGVRQAEEILHQVRARVGDLDVAYVASAPYDGNLFNRVARRRCDHGIQGFWYQSVTDEVAFITDKPHGGPEAPRTSTAVSPGEAVEWLVENCLLVPNHKAHGWSIGWRFPKERSTPSDLISLAPLRPAEVASLLTRFGREAKRRLGIEIIGERVLEPDRSKLIGLLQELKDEYLSARC